MWQNHLWPTQLWIARYGTTQPVVIIIVSVLRCTISDPDCTFCNVWDASSCSQKGGGNTKYLGKQIYLPHPVKYIEVRQLRWTLCNYTGYKRCSCTGGYTRYNYSGAEYMGYTCERSSTTTCQLDVPAVLYDERSDLSGQECSIQLSCSWLMKRVQHHSQDTAAGSDHSSEGRDIQDKKTKNKVSTVSRKGAGADKWRIISEFSAFRGLQICRKWFYYLVLYGSSDI